MRSSPACWRRCLRAAGWRCPTPARDVHPQQVTEAASRFNQLAPANATLRTRAEILRLFDGLELLEPGLVQIHRWRPGLAAPGRNQEAAGYCGLARKT